MLERSRNPRSPTDVCVPPPPLLFNRWDETRWWDASGQPGGTRRLENKNRNWWWIEYWISVIIQCTLLAEWERKPCYHSGAKYELFGRMTVETEVAKGSNYCSWCYPILLCISIRLVHGFLATACQRIQCFLKQPTALQLKLIMNTFLSQINPLHIDNQSFRYLTPSGEQGVH
jgi:hypothetical protein